jgi:hypothetical protein
MIPIHQTGVSIRGQPKVGMQFDSLSDVVIALEDSMPTLAFSFGMKYSAGRGTTGALPHGKSSFVCFKHLLSSDSALVCPPRPQRRSSALEREKNLASVKEKEKDVS